MDWTNGGKLAENLIALKSYVAKQNITLDVNFIFFGSVVTREISLIPTLSSLPQVPRGWDGVNNFSEFVCL